MRRIPKKGDTVLIAPYSRHGRDSAITREREVTSVGRKYFQAGGAEFEIDSFANGAWADKALQYGHSRMAYLSAEVYGKLMLKREQARVIKEINMERWCCAKANAVLNFIESFDDMEDSEEWEQKS